MICYTCFDKMTRERDYDLVTGMKSTWAVCRDCKRDVCIWSRELQPSDQDVMLRLFYEGDTETERLRY
jgi:hypothetical protein